MLCVCACVHITCFPIPKQWNHFTRGHKRVLHSQLGIPPPWQPLDDAFRPPDKKLRATWRPLGCLQRLQLVALRAHEGLWGLSAHVGLFIFPLGDEPLGADLGGSGAPGCGGTRRSRPRQTRRRRRPHLRHKAPKPFSENRRHLFQEGLRFFSGLAG